MLMHVKPISLSDYFIDSQNELGVVVQPVDRPQVEPVGVANMFSNEFKFCPTGAR